jgi:hypothetical protein
VSTSGPSGKRDIEPAPLQGALALLALELGAALGHPLLDPLLGGVDGLTRAGALGRIEVADPAKQLCDGALAAQEASAGRRESLERRRRGDGRASLRLQRLEVLGSRRHARRRA